MHPGPKPLTLVLTPAEEAELARIARRAHGSQVLASRARIILACARPGATNSGVARQLNVCRPSVIAWRTRFAAQRMDALCDAPRSGAPRTMQDEEVERLLVLTLESQPANATHWSSRAMAARAGLSQTMVKAGVARLRLGPPSARDLQTLQRPRLCGQGA
jgi:transposase-like protein